MKGLFLTMILLSLSSCGRPVSDEQASSTAQIDAELKPYVDMFLQDASRLGRNVTIGGLIVKFDNDLGNKNFIATCKTGSKMLPTITFSNNFYNYYKSRGMFNDIEQVMFHELGHCLLGLQHNDAIDQRTRYPVSIMNTYHFSGDLYNKFRDSYLMQLFFYTPNNFRQQ